MVAKLAAIKSFYEREAMTSRKIRKPPFNIKM